MRTRQALLTGCAVLLAACGGPSEQPGPDPGRPSAAAKSPSHSRRAEAPAAFPAIGQGADQQALGASGLSLEQVQAMRDLAALAEQAAGEQQAVGTADGAVLPGGDISWPQCPRGLGIPQKRTLGLPAPLPEARFVVIGLTNGPGFYPNPCLGDQVRQMQRRRLLLSAYAVVSYPDADTLARFGDDGPHDGATRSGALRNVGYQQALYNVRSMRAAGLDTPFVWVDVEPVAFFEWSADPVANAAVVEGTVRGYRDAGYDVGVYSTPYLWRAVVGDLRLGVPEWRAAGQTSREEALSRCAGESIQGGEAVLGQWVADSRDLDVTCPGASRDLGRYFATSKATGG